MQRTPRGNKYMLSFMDENQGQTDMAFIKKYSDMKESFKLFKITFDLQNGTKILRVHSDEGGA